MLPCKKASRIGRRKKHRYVHRIAFLRWHNPDQVQGSGRLALSAPQSSPRILSVFFCRKASYHNRHGLSIKKPGRKVSDVSPGRGAKAKTTLFRAGPREIRRQICFGSLALSRRLTNPKTCIGESGLGALYDPIYRRVGKEAPASNLTATSFKCSRMGRCWGQALSHCPQPMQSEALPCLRDMLL